MKNLVAKLQNPFDGSPWYGGSLMEKLDSIHFSLVDHRPVGSLNSIARLVQHIINWRIFALKKLEGDATYDIRLNDPNDWSDPGVSTEEDWDELLYTLKKTQAKLIALLSDKTDAFLDEQVPGKKYSYGYLVEGIIQHDIYHLGQISWAAKLAHLDF